MPYDVAWMDNGRFECKYAMPVAHRERLLDAATDIQPDPHAEDLGGGKMGYHVHSIYYDTPEFKDFYERLDENQIRDRLRARTYGRPGDRAPVFLENKRKLDDRVVKSRGYITDADSWCATDEPWPWRRWMDGLKGKNLRVAREFDRLVAGVRRPVSVVHYAREVWVSTRKDQPKVRLTLDLEVTATVAPKARDLYAPPDVWLLPEDWMVVELKYDGDRPGWMRRIAKELGLRAHPVSKFGLSVALGMRRDHLHARRYLIPKPLRDLGWMLEAA